MCFILVFYTLTTYLTAGVSVNVCVCVGGGGGSIQCYKDKPSQKILKH